MEWCDTDLDKLLYGDTEKDEAQKRTGRRLYPSEHGALTEEMVLDFAAQIVDGIAYVHSQAALDDKGDEEPMCHLDIKPQNIMLNKYKGNWVAKVADFGMKNSYPYGTWEYMAPECSDPKHGEPCQASDVFSFGMTLWEMVANLGDSKVRHRIYEAFPGVEDNYVTDEETGERSVNVKIIPDRVASGQRPAAPSQCPPLLFKLMQACWVTDPKKRPMMKKLGEALRRIRDRLKPGAAEPEPEPETEPQPKPEPESAPGPLTLDTWLAELGLADHVDTVSDYVSESTAIADVIGMLEAEKEDADEDLKDLIKDMKLDRKKAKAFRSAIATLRSRLAAEKQAEEQAKQHAEELAREEHMDRAWEALKEELGMKDKRTVQDELEQEKRENEKLRDQLDKRRGRLPIWSRSR